MEETISQILQGCKLAKDLEANLPNIASQPRFLRHLCLEIATTFNSAIHRLNSQDPSLSDVHTVFRETPTGSHLYVGVEGGSEGESSSQVYMQAMNLLHARASAEDNPFYMRRQSESTMPLGKLGSDVAATSGVGVLALKYGSRNTDPEAFLGSVGAALVVAEGSGSRRTEIRSSVERSSKKRKDGESRLERVPALRTGNMDIPPDDGYTWRKYGQKDILGRKFPRSYYRCTHKNFYGCKAQKQVQRLDEDPYMYEVTYCGVHSCRTSPTPLILPPLPPPINNPQGEALMSECSQSPTSPTTSIQLSSWFSRELDTSQRGVQTLAGRSGTDIGSSQVQGGRDMDCPVTDLADSMFNPGSSCSGMEIIFTSKKDSWRGDREA